MRKISKELRDLNHNIKDHIDKGNDPKKYMNFTQFQIVKYLFDHEGDKVCQKDLEIETHLKKASITGSIDNLEDKGIVRRVQSKSDKRKNYIQVTQKVDDMKKTFEKRIEETEKLLLKGISKEDMDVFYKVLDQMNNNLRKGK